jgi:uroporphyrinogen decarboxylase
MCYPVMSQSAMPSQPPVAATLAEVEAVLRCTAPARAPLFLPAIYEHKAWFIGRTPSAIARDPDLLTRALLAEYAAIGPDALTVGVDVYNVEAEAAGCPVVYHEGDDPSIPGLATGHFRLTVGDDPAALPVPNPLVAGRMPVNLAAARNVRRELGDDVWVRGALSGPFSLAIALVGTEELFLACLDQPDWVHRVLAHATRIIEAYARAYLDAGVGLILFDSQASPGLISPAMYEEFVLPVTRTFIQWAAAQGVRDVPLIIGGNTTAIAGLMAQTGANNLLCDYPADLDRMAAVCRDHGRAFRRNLPPRLLETAAPDEVYAAAAAELNRGRGLPGFMLGTAVIPFGTPLANILAVKRACRDAARLAAQPIHP